MILDEQIKQAAEEEYPGGQLISRRLINFSEITSIQKSCFTAGAKWAISHDDWIEIKEGCEMPDDDRWIILMTHDGNFAVMMTDKDDYSFRDMIGVPVTHWKYITYPNPTSINNTK